MSSLYSVCYSYTKGILYPINKFLTYQLLEHFFLTPPSIEFVLTLLGFLDCIIGLVRPVGVLSISDSDSSLLLTFDAEWTSDSDVDVGGSVPGSNLTVSFFSKDSVSFGGVKAVVSPSINLKMSLIMSKFFVSFSLVNADTAT